MSTPQPRRLGQELHLGTRDLWTSERSRGARDPRTWRDRLLLRRFRPEAPTWTRDGHAHRLRIGGGALGAGSLWTRPIPIPAGQAPTLARLHYLERCALGGASAERLVIGHLRETPHLGDGDDLATRELRVGGTGEPAWRGRVHDFADLCAEAFDRRRYLTVEVRAAATATGLGSFELEVAHAVFSMAWDFPSRPPTRAPEEASARRVAVQAPMASSPAVAAEASLHSAQG